MKQLIFLLTLPILGLAQHNQGIDASRSRRIDDLKSQLGSRVDDSSRVSMMSEIGFLYEFSKVDSALKYYQSALDFAKRHGIAWGESRLMTSISGIVRQQGKLAESLDLLLRALKIAQDNHLPREIARAYRRISDIYFDLENLPKAVEYVFQALKIDEQNNIKAGAAVDHWTLGVTYEKMNKLDSATFYLDKAFVQTDVIKRFLHGYYEVAGNIQAKKGNHVQATSIYQQGLKVAEQNNELITSSQICANLAQLFIKTNRKDSAIVYALKGFKYGQEVSFKKGVILNGSLLAELYESTQPTVALKYYKIAAAAKDSLFGVNNIQTIQNLVTREQTKQKELEDAKISFQNRIKWYAALSTLLGVLVVAFMLYKNNMQKQKANSLLSQQKETVENTLKDLKSTQAQLIQSEKLASLGELTAGIAHEIQNPLNFVNNFAEVSAEMLDEMHEELEKGDTTEAIAIASDLKTNLEKINHHGQRASSIVKGMLEHSRASTGIKEPTDLNALADEYLRLAYHGLRAKDNSFNAKMETHFDPELPKVLVIPQDIGRVLLNLINNAFYAVAERSRSTVGAPLVGAQPYEPTVSVSTQKLDNAIEIQVQDNGNGIPETIKDKIFQPFFTTKPTGQGTGLGLSLAYDIIKAHGGNLEVTSTPKESTAFVLSIPI